MKLPCENNIRVLEKSVELLIIWSYYNFLFRFVFPFDYLPLDTWLCKTKFTIK